MTSENREHHVCVFIKWRCPVRLSCCVVVVCWRAATRGRSCDSSGGHVGLVVSFCLAQQCLLGVVIKHVLCAYTGCFCSRGVVLYGGVLQLDAREDFVSPGTENLFQDDFWESLDFVTNALDNVKARLYVDSRWVLLV